MFPSDDHRFGRTTVPSDCRAKLHAELSDLRKQVMGKQFLRTVLDNDWFHSVGETIAEIGADGKFNNDRYHLFRIFRDEPWLVGYLDHAMHRIETLAVENRRLKYFRETKKMLRALWRTKSRLQCLRLYFCPTWRMWR